MNEEVENVISNSLNGFQWVLAGMVVLLILYLIISKSNKK